MFEATTMQAQLVSLVYVSNASWLLEDAELEEILRVSRANNQRDRITGMLLYKSGNIIQVLEGPEDKISALLDKLRYDPRHYGVQVLLCDQINERQFDQWAMAFHRVASDAPRDVEGLSDFLDDEVAAEAFRSNPGNAFRLLLSFRKNIK